MKLRITAEPHSDVALLALDAGLFVLNNENKLTREQVHANAILADHHKKWFFYLLNISLQFTHYYKSISYMKFNSLGQ